MKSFVYALLGVLAVGGQARAQTPDDPPQEPVARPMAVEYSDGYQIRAKIHKYASVATLPLFATELALGQSLYDGTGSNAKRSTHAVVGGAIGGLFALNSVTGVWNLMEARKDPAGRKRRLIHGLLMLGGDAGFVATTATAPSHGRNGLVTFSASEGTHRTIAITSIGIASAGYLMMLFGNH